MVPIAYGKSQHDTVDTPTQQLHTHLDTIPVIYAENTLFSPSFEHDIKTTKTFSVALWRVTGERKVILLWLPSSPHLQPRHPHILKGHVNS